MRRRLRRLLGGLLELRYAIPLTPLGGLLLAAALWLFFGPAADASDFVLRAAAGIAAALVLANLAGVLIAAALLAAALRRSPPADLTLESGVRAATGFTLPRHRGWPLVEVGAAWREPARVSVSLEPLRGRLQEVVLPRERGRGRRVRRRIVVSDIFGLARLGLPHTSPGRIVVLPGPARLRGQAIISLAGGDLLSDPSGPTAGDLVDMRRYAPGDPLRLVLWKVYARSRKLMVRMPERAISPTPTAAAYFVAGPDDEASAAAARHFLEAGLLGEAPLFSADGADGATTDTGEAVDMIVDSVRHREAGGAGLGRFLATAERQRRGRVVLFLPPRPGPFVERLASCARRLGGAIAVVAVDTALTPPRRAPVRRLLFAPGEGEAAAPRDLARLLARLGALGLDVRVVHRPSGEVLPAARIEALAA